MVSSRVAARPARSSAAMSSIQRHKQLTGLEKSELVGMNTAGMSYHSIAGDTGIPYITVRDAINNYKKRCSCDRKCGSGRPRKTTLSEDHHMLLAFRRDRQSTCSEVAKDLYSNRISADTVSRRIHELSDLSSHYKSKKPFVSSKNRRRRINWCMARLHYTKVQWRRYLFSDESPYVVRFHGKTRIWQTRNELFLPWALTGTVKHDKKINVWGCFCAHGVGNLYRVEGNMEQV
jgi:transposase